MKFKDLIKKYSTQSIIKMIHELYPKQRGTLGSYRKIIQSKRYHSQLKEKSNRNEIEEFELEVLNSLF